MLSIELYFLVQ